MTDVQGLPYFEGDFWPNVIEEQIKELELEEERIATEANEAEVCTVLPHLTTPQLFVSWA